MQIQPRTSTEQCSQIKHPTDDAFLPIGDRRVVLFRDEQRWRLWRPLLFDGWLGWQPWYQGSLNRGLSVGGYPCMLQQICSYVSDPAHVFVICVQSCVTSDILMRSKWLKAGACAYRLLVTLYITQTSSCLFRLIYTPWGNVLLEKLTVIHLVKVKVFTI